VKIGLLGGSFDPIHKGHIAVANFVLNDLKLDDVWFLPTGNHPFKNKMLAYDKRKELISAVIEGYPDLKVFDYDKKYDDFSYTDILIKKLKNKFPQNSFYFIIGIDCLKDFEKWHNYKWVLDNVEIVVVNRPEEYVNSLEENKFSNRMQFIKMPPVATSSTIIREKVSRSQSISEDVPTIICEKVYDYYAKQT